MRRRADRSPPTTSTAQRSQRSTRWPPSPRRSGVEVEVEREPARVQAAKRPLDVAQQLLRALYKAVALQERLHMDASRVPGLSLERASPPGNHDLVNQLRAELARIGWHLGTTEAGPARPAPPEGEGAGGAFAAAQAIVRALDRLADAAPE